jgi:hypothetical protein
LRYRRRGAVEPICRNGPCGVAHPARSSNSASFCQKVASMYSASARDQGALGAAHPIGPSCSFRDRANALSSAASGHGARWRLWDRAGAGSPFWGRTRGHYDQCADAHIWSWLCGAIHANEAYGSAETMAFDLAVSHADEQIGAEVTVWMEADFFQAPSKLAICDPCPMTA